MSDKYWWFSTKKNFIFNTRPILVYAGTIKNQSARRGIFLSKGIYRVNMAMSISIGAIFAGTRMLDEGSDISCIDTGSSRLKCNNAVKMVSRRLNPWKAAMPLSSGHLVTIHMARHVICTHLFQACQKHLHYPDSHIFVLKYMTTRSIWQRTKNIDMPMLNNPSHLPSTSRLLDIHWPKCR